MLRFLKLVRHAFWTTIAVAIISAFVVTATFQSNMTPSWKQISQDDNIDDSISSAEVKAISKSRTSAVKIRSMSINFFAGTSTMTGTYFVAKGKPYVLTVHHGIMGPCLLIMISHDDQDYLCKEYVVVDKYNDYIIMELEQEIENRIPIKIPEDLPRGSQWKKSYSLLNKLIYTGYPNAIGPLTLRGDVIGYGDDEFIYIFSHAYGGASGSGVFSKEGKYIGYVVAIDVGSTELGVDVLENVVIVASALNVDWTAVLD